MASEESDEDEQTPDSVGVRDVEYWLGVYKTIDDVPARYRVEHHEGRFVEEDTWEKYLQTRDLAVSTKKNSWNPCGNRFKKFMHEEVGRHHALANPNDVERYLSHIKDGGYSIKVIERSHSTVYYQHLSPLKLFFTWLVHHVDYPHVYNPVIFAAHRGGITRELWYWQVDYKQGLGHDDE